LSSRARVLIEDPANHRLLSAATLWEMAIKASLGKLRLRAPFSELIPSQIAATGIEILPVSLPHAALVADLPFHHRDPFDRMLAAQCRVDRLPIVSADPAFDHYCVERFW
jgi:PIN domain nuclease of toxin-antitoxin system